MKRTHGLLFIPVILFVCTLIACASLSTSPSTSGTIQEQTAWSMDNACLECHQAEGTSDANSACMSSMRASENCITCHTDEKDRLTAAHKDYDSGAIAVKLKKTKVSRDACLSCHSIDELIASQASSTILTDYYGEVANPHDIPVNTDHTRDLGCGVCHKMHLGGSASDIAPDVCEGCHHYNVYTCHPCHNPITGAGITG